MPELFIILSETMQSVNEKCDKILEVIKLFDVCRGIALLFLGFQSISGHQFAAALLDVVDYFGIRRSQKLYE